MLLFIVSKSLRGHTNYKHHHQCPPEVYVTFDNCQVLSNTHCTKTGGKCEGWKLLILKLLQNITMFFFALKLQCADWNEICESTELLAGVPWKPTKLQVSDQAGETQLVAGRGTEVLQVCYRSKGSGTALTQQPFWPSQEKAQVLSDAASAQCFPTCGIFNQIWSVDQTIITSRVKIWQHATHTLEIMLESNRSYNNVLRWLQANLSSWVERKRWSGSQKELATAITKSMRTQSKLKYNWNTTELQVSTILGSEFPLKTPVPVACLCLRCP